MNRDTLKRAAIGVVVVVLVGHGGYRSDGWTGVLTGLGTLGIGWMLALGWLEGRLNRQWLEHQERETEAFRRGYEQRGRDDTNARAAWARKVREHQTRKTA